VIVGFNELWVGKRAYRILQGQKFSSLNDLRDAAACQRHARRQAYGHIPQSLHGLFVFCAETEVGKLENGSHDFGGEEGARIRISLGINATMMEDLKLLMSPSISTSKSSCRYL